MITGPCYECEKRTPGCHSSCEDYLSYKAKKDEIRDKRHEFQRNNVMLNDVQFHSQKKKGKQVRSYNTN